METTEFRNYETENFESRYRLGDRRAWGSGGGEMQFEGVRARVQVDKDVYLTPPEGVFETLADIHRGLAVD